MGIEVPQNPQIPCTQIDLVLGCSSCFIYDLFKMCILGLNNHKNLKVGGQQDGSVGKHACAKPDEPSSMSESYMVNPSANFSLNNT